MPIDDFFDNDVLLERYADWLAWLREKKAYYEAQLAKLEKNRQKSAAATKGEPDALPLSGFFEEEATEQPVAADGISDPVATEAISPEASPLQKMDTWL